MYILSFFVDSQ